MGRLHIENSHGAGVMALVRPATAAHAEARRVQGPESLDAVFGTGPFSHQIVLSLTCADGALDALVEAAEETGARLQSLNLAELDGGYCVKLWIKGIGCDAARRLSDRIASLAEVTYAHVEHHLGRAP